VKKLQIAIGMDDITVSMTVTGITTMTALAIEPADALLSRRM
jgi:hypothetical protein